MKTLAKVQLLGDVSGHVDSLIDIDIDNYQRHRFGALQWEVKTLDCIASPPFCFVFKTKCQLATQLAVYTKCLKGKEKKA